MKTNLNKLNRLEKKLDKSREDFFKLQEKFEAEQKELIDTRKDILYTLFEKSELDFEEYIKRLEIRDDTNELQEN